MAHPENKIIFQKNPMRLANRITSHRKKWCICETANYCSRKIKSIWLLGKIRILWLHKLSALNLKRRNVVCRRQTYCSVELGSLSEFSCSSENDT